MKSLITLTHPDESSGTTIATDGTKVYWTEGFSTATVISPYGGVLHIDAQDPALAWLDDLGQTRVMTRAEMAEYDLVHNGDGIFPAVLKD